MCIRDRDNPSLVKDIMLQITTNDDVMKDIIEKEDDFVNNQDVIAETVSYTHLCVLQSVRNRISITYSVLKCAKP